MGKSCAIIPRVRNSKGEKVDSKLFKDLLSFLPSRAEARKVYLITKTLLKLQLKRDMKLEK